MRSTRKARRIQMLVFGGVLLVAASALFGFLAQDAIAFFMSPADLLARAPSPDQLLRVGGLVVDGSVSSQGPVNRFELTDGAASVAVVFEGVLPDLFKEGQGLIAEGYMKGEVFEATEVLAKHDENYMPKEVADALREQGHFHGDQQN
ncbi:MAG: cytochrome c maturation protein CcmE [Pseudomonadota bacterium]